MDTQHLHLYNQNGVGRIVCKDCGHIEHKVIAFTHRFGDGSCSTHGIQCLKCGAFYRYTNVSQYMRPKKKEVKYTGRSIIFKMKCDEKDGLGEICFAMFLPKWLQRFFELEKVKEETSAPPKPAFDGCPKCHSQEINRNPAFCPKCKSYNVKYECEYET